MNVDSPGGLILLSGLSKGTPFVIACKGAADRKLSGQTWYNPLLS